VLPPRPLAVNWPAASEQVRIQAESWAPFDIELTTLRVFPVTDVLYLEVGAGGDELRQMHQAMNRDCLEFEEPFPYHPHITLAQEVAHEAVPGLIELTARRWREYRGPRTFMAERAVFVQNTLDNRWIDLAEYFLGAVAVR
jgi:2'-5' RNA ligase